MLKIIPLGGIGGVTKNMYLYEEDGQILIIDCGIGFPDPTMLGVDLLIPDVTYLESKKDQIVGLLLTHAHDDHIAGLSYILPKLGRIPIYASRLTRGFALDRLKEFHLPANIQVIDTQPFSVGSFTITPIKVTHSVPDARHFAIKTKQGIIYHGSDFKFDPAPIDAVLSQKDRIRKIGDQGVLCLLSDCLRSEKSGHSLSESILTESFRREIKDTQGKFIVTVMSSNVHRIQQAVDVASSFNRRIAFIGRSVEANIKTATKLGFLKLPQKALINKRQISHLKPRQVAIIIAGSQGQEGSSLSRAVAGEHRYVKLQPNDKVVFASDPIPGNEQNVYSLIDELSRQEVDVAYTDISDSLHVSGHGYSDEQKELIQLTRPKYLIPIGGTFRHMVQYRKLARSLNYRDNQVFLLQDGQTVNLQSGQARLGETLTLKNILVDGLGIGDVGNIVLRDRQTMAQDGIVVVVVPVNYQTGQVAGRTEVISRGFVFMKQAQNLIKQIDQQVKKVLKPHRGAIKNWSDLRKKVDTHLQKFLYQKTQRRPLILTVLLEV